MAVEIVSVTLLEPPALPRVIEAKEMAGEEALTVTPALALIVTVSIAVGTWAGVQQAALYQLLSQPPIQPMLAARAPVGRRRSAKADAIKAIYRARA